VHVVSNHALKLSLEDGDTTGEFFSSVVEVKVVISNELLE